MGAKVSVFLGATVLEAGLGLLAIGLGVAVGHNPLSGLVLSPQQLFVGVAAALPPLGVLACMRRSRVPAVQRLLGSARRIVHGFLMPLSRPRIVLLSAAAGFGEELLFRGLLQALATARFGPVVALVSTSLVFGVLHFLSKAYAVYAFVFSMYLGSLYLLTGNILVPILAHAVYDAAALHLSSLREPVTPILPAEQGTD